MRHNSPGSAIFVTPTVLSWCALAFCAVESVAQPVCQSRKSPTMPVTPELRAQILRYRLDELWRTGTIAAQLHVHHGTVERILRQEGLPYVGVVRTSNIDSFLPFIAETLKKLPDLRASRLYAMVKERGYKGGPDHFRHLISHHRPRPLPEAYLRLVTLVGEQGQIDWGHFGHLQIGQAKRPLIPDGDPNSPTCGHPNSPTPLRRDDRLNPVFCHR